VLEKTAIPQKYFLSSTACAGILRRAEKRGKKLPEPLRLALEQAASREPTKHAADTCKHSGGGNTSGSIDVATCLTTSGQRLDFDTETFAIQAGALRTNPSSGPDGIGAQSGITYTMEARSEVQAVCVTGEITHTLKAEGFDASEDGTGRGQPIVPAISVFDPNQVTSATNRSKPTTELCHTLPARSEPPVAYSVALRGREGGGTAELGDEVAGCLRASTGGGDKPHVLSHVADTRTSSWHQSNGATGGNNPGVINPVIHGMAVRRLMPTECEALQAFPRNYTNIPDAADGPRYKSLGNSMCVNVMAFIGRRIQQATAKLKEAA